MVLLVNYSVRPSFLCLNEMKLEKKARAPATVIACGNFTHDNAEGKILSNY